MRKSAPLWSVCVLAMVPQVRAEDPAQGKQMHDASATTYEHLATAIIEIRQTEDNLVKGILMHHHAMAQQHLTEATEAEGAEGKAHLEAAAEEITNIANEGNKRVQAVRQRLLKAGHHHHTDAETKEDYIFINGKEKKALLDFAGRVAKTDGDASAEVIESLKGDLNSTFQKATAPE